MRQNAVLEKSYALALEVVRLSRTLAFRREPVLCRQLLRAGTSVGANVEEAMAAQSRRDFVSKLSIARKEARECRYWLRILRDSEVIAASDVTTALGLTDETVRILTSIILTVHVGGPDAPIRNS